MSYIVQSMHTQYNAAHKCFASELVLQAGRFLRPNCAPRSECPQFGMPAERRAQFRMCPDPEFPNTLHSEFMNTPNVDFLNIPLQRAYVIRCHLPVPNGIVCCATGTPQHAGACSEHSADGGCIALDGGVASILALWQ